MQPTKRTTKVVVSWQDIIQAMPSLQAVDGGFSHARRGIVTMQDGTRLFVKQASDEKTLEWIKLELTAYHWLHQQQYPYVPVLVSYSDDGFALPDLSDWDWADHWTKPKVDSALQALRSLHELSAKAYGMMPPIGGAQLDSNPWLDLPDSAAAYKQLADDRQLKTVTEILSLTGFRQEYTELAATEPWKGNDLVHYDARADNFAYNSATDQGVLVDWNWLQWGSAAFDRTALLVNVQLSGFDVVSDYRRQLDKNSLAWLVGFWLKHALGPQDTPGLKRLRPRQVRNALLAHALIPRL